MEELNEVLNLQESKSHTLPLVKSKPIPKRTLSKRWKQGDWLRTLFGQMLKPSQESSFLEKWIYSLEDSHVSHFQVQEVETQTKTQDTSFQLASEQLSLLDLIESSSKMSLDSLVQNSEEMDGQTQKEHHYLSMSLENWKGEVIKQRGEYSVRVKQEHLIREKESLSLGSWPTPMMWDCNQGEHLEAFNKRAATQKEKGVNLHKPLKTIVLHYAHKNWPTPTVAGLVEGGVCKDVSLTDKGFKATRQRTKTQFGAKCRDAVLWHEKNWPTPCARDHQDPYGIHKTFRKDGKERLDTLPRQVYQNEDQKNWPTATARDWKGHYPPGKHIASNGANRLSLLPDMAIYGPQGQDNLKDEWKSLELNPSWVEQLMGLPTGLSDLGCWGTE